MAILLELDTGTALVRIHSGERTKEERNAAIKRAMENYFRVIYPQLVKLGKLEKYTLSTSQSEVTGLENTGV